MIDHLSARLDVVIRRLNCHRSMTARILGTIGGMTEDDIRRLGYEYFLRTAGLGVKSLNVIGELVGEVWPPSKAIDLRPVPTQALIQELKQRGYLARREIEP